MRPPTLKQHISSAPLLLPAVILSNELDCSRTRDCLLVGEGGSPWFAAELRGISEHA
jgi:hypothetical protein